MGISSSSLATNKNVPHPILSLQWTSDKRPLITVDLPDDPTCFDLHSRGGHVRRAAVGRVALPVVVARPRGRRRGRGVHQRGRVRHRGRGLRHLRRHRVQPVGGERPRRREGPVRRQGLVVRVLEVLQVVMVVVVMVVRERGRRRLR